MRQNNNQSNDYTIGIHRRNQNREQIRHFMWLFLIQFSSFDYVNKTLKNH